MSYVHSASINHISIQVIGRITQKSLSDFSV